VTLPSDTRSNASQFPAKLVSSPQIYQAIKPKPGKVDPAASPECCAREN